MMAVAPSHAGVEREHLVVVTLIVPGSATMFSLDFKVVSSAEQEMDVPGAEVVRGREGP